MPVMCLHCDKPTKMVTGEVIYPHRKDLHDYNYWLCDCGAYCGCHKGGSGRKALGRPCNAETRNARSHVHRMFDPLWKSKRMRRGVAYRLLANKMNISGDDCHISLFTIEQCRDAYRAARELRKWQESKT